jgi:hypothetical protein
MHARNDHGQPNCCKQAATNNRHDTSLGTEELKDNRQTVTAPRTKRSKQAKRKGDSQGKRAKRRKDRGERIGHVLAQELLEHGHQRNREQNGNNRLRIVCRHARDAINAKGFSLGCHLHKRRFDKHTAHKSAVHGRGANVLGSRKAQEDRNEIERHVVEHIEQDI